MAITTFKIDNPTSANAFSLEVAQGLRAAMKSALKLKQSGVIITAEGSTFCAGGDLKSYKKLKSKSAGMLVNKKITDILNELRAAPLLIVAAIEGDVIGGGCELALACDYIIASNACRFSFRQISQNLITGWGGSKRLLRRCSQSTALDWLLSARWVSSAEAFQKGLIDQVVLQGQTLNEAREFIDGRSHFLLPVVKDIIYKEGLDEEKAFNKLWWSKEHLRILK